MDAQGWFERLFEEHKRLTDVHLHEGESVRIRVDGRLTRIEARAEDVLFDAVAQAAGWPARWREQLQGHYRLTGSGLVGQFRCRLHAYRHKGGVGVALRRFPAMIPPFGDLGLPSSVLNIVDAMHGLFLVAGATNSGKSTTLAALVEHLAVRPIHIVTIEDPVEYVHVGNEALITTKQIARDTEGFAQALRDALREDPDVIMLGEIRDAETMRIALSAAETGHLVMGTLHANSAVGVVDRVLDFFALGDHDVVRALVASTICGIVAQQLLPNAAGRGLVLAYEIMEMRPTIAALIRSGRVMELRAAITNPSDGNRRNLELLNTTLVRLLREGRITEEVARVAAYDQEELEGRLSKNGSARQSTRAA